jgi:hypothetical protein
MKFKIKYTPQVRISLGNYNNTAMQAPWQLYKKGKMFWRFVGNYQTKEDLFNDARILANTKSGNFTIAIDGSVVWG